MSKDKKDDDFIDLDLDLEDEVEVEEADEEVEDIDEVFNLDIDDPAPKADTKPVKKPVPTPPKVKVDPVQKPKPASSPAAPKVTDFEEVPFIEFGTTVQRYAFNRFKASKDTKSRVCVLTTKIVPLKTHFHDKVGSYICFEGKCCEVDGYSKLRYCIPVVVYDTDKTGKPVSKKLSIQILAVGQEKYQELIDLSQEYPITKHDLVISCSDEKYQKYSFMASKSDKPLWKTFDTAQALVDEWNKNKAKAYESVARRLTPAAFIAALGKASVSVENQITTLPDSVIETEDAFED